MRFSRIAFDFTRTRAIYSSVIRWIHSVRLRILHGNLISTQESFEFLSDRRRFFLTFAIIEKSAFEIIDRRSRRERIQSVDESWKQYRAVS